MRAPSKVRQRGLLRLWAILSSLIESGEDSRCWSNLYRNSFETAHLAGDASGHVPRRRHSTSPEALKEVFGCTRDGGTLDVASSESDRDAWLLSSGYDSARGLTAGVGIGSKVQSGAR